MNAEKMTNKYGRLYIKHWKAGNEKMARYYHKKLHEIYEQNKTCKVCFGHKYFTVSSIDCRGIATKIKKQRCLYCNA